MDVMSECFCYCMSLLKIKSYVKHIHCVVSFHVCGFFFNSGQSLRIPRGRQKPLIKEGQTIHRPTGETMI